MTGSRFHVKRKPAELVRCRGCGRLTQRATAREGPGGLYGEECLPRASALESRPLLPPEYMPDCAEADVDNCATPTDRVDWDHKTERYLCRTHRNASLPRGCTGPPPADS